jgi:acyl-CoA synthetase (AMP-forming)/AMP-acid ligase II
LNDYFLSLSSNRSNIPIVNIADAFQFQAFYHPTSLAACVPGSHYGPVSFGRLQAMSNGIGWRCLAAGLRPGHVVAILSNDPIFQLATILALERIGAVSLSTGQSSLPDEFTVDAAITDGPQEVIGCEQVLTADWSWRIGDDRMLPRHDDFEKYDNAFTRIVLTSATTGDPKAIGLTQEMMVRRIHACDSIFGDVVPTCGRVFIDIGLTTSWGYLWAMKVLTRGGSVFFRGSDPAETLQAFGLYRVQCMIGSPASAAEFVGYYENSPDFICPFETMLSSGGMLSATLSERVRTRMCTHLIATYAATEITPLASAPAHRIAGTMGAVGYIAPWIGAEAVDDDDQPVSSGEQGRIRFRGHCCVPGYIGTPRNAADVFKDGWFYPGDLGTITPERLLIIAGREKAIINVGGNKVNPEAIESVLLSHPSVVRAGAFCRANAAGVDEVWAVVTAREGFDVQAVRAYCAGALPALFVPTHIVRVADMPQNDMGRIVRNKLEAIAPARP